MLGNCLYDKDYTKQVQKIKVPAVSANEWTFLTARQNSTSKTSRGDRNSHLKVHQPA